MDAERLKQKIGNKIYDLRTGYDLTQEEFASKLELHISTSNISKIEQGHIVPSAEFIRAVCITYKISPSWLLSIDYEIPSSISIKEKKLINSFNSLPEKKKALILDLLDCLLD